MATLILSFSLLLKALLFIMEVSDSSSVDHPPAASHPARLAGAIHSILVAF
jgi:hypothetical protein